MFMVPTLARARLIEDAVRHQRITVRVAKLPIVVVLRSRTISETRGLMKTPVEACSEYSIFDASSAGPPVTGRVAAKGLSNEIHDRGYVIIDGVDGRSPASASPVLTMRAGARKTGLERLSPVYGSSQCPLSQRRLNCTSVLDTGRNTNERRVLLGAERAVVT
jgi:hypothetical protein